MQGVTIAYCLWGSDNSAEMRRRLASFHWLSPLIAVLVIAAWGYSRSPWHAWDDAFITYRYAENLRNGIGFIYNAGENVLGITTPLYGLVLAALGLIVPNTVLSGHWLAVFGWAATAVGAGQLLRSYDQSVAAFVAPLLIAIHPLLLLALGMETNLLVALMLWSAYAWRKENYWLTVIFAALLILIRQDTAIWLLIFGLASWRKTGRFPWREGVATALVTIPWFSYAWLTYGNPLPNSASAKIGQNNLMPVGNSVPFYEAFWLNVVGGMATWSIVVVVLMLTIGLWHILVNERKLLWLPLWLVAYLGLYITIGVVSFPWYFIPALTVLLMIFSIGLGVVARVFTVRLNRWSVLVLVGILFGSIAYPFVDASIKTVGQRSTRAHYADVGNWLRANASIGAEIATIEIGLIGYLANRPILDTMGLVSTDMTTHQVGWAETLIYALNSRQPEYAVALPETAWDVVIEQPWFVNQYAIAAVVGDITIFERQSLRPGLIFEEEIALADGFSVVGISAESTELTPGESFDFWLNIDVQETPLSNYQVTSFLIDNETYERVGIISAEPFAGQYTTRRWQPDDKLEIPVSIPIPSNVVSGSYRIGVLFYDTNRDSYLGTVTAPDLTPADITLGWLTVGSPANASITKTNTFDPIRWENGISLTAIQTEQVDNVLSVTVKWDTSSQPIRNLKQFLHLVDSEGNIVTQSDTFPFNGRWPTPVWKPKNTYIDRFELMLPDLNSNEGYLLRIGFYDSIGQLPVTNSTFPYFFLENVIKHDE